MATIYRAQIRGKRVTHLDSAADFGTELPIMWKHVAGKLHSSVRIQLPARAELPVKVFRVKFRIADDPIGMSKRYSVTRDKDTKREYGDTLRFSSIII